MNDTNDISVDVIDEELQERAVKSSEFADFLRIAESTVRKYASILEKEGHVFRKDASGARVFSKKDQLIYTEMIEYKRKQGVSLEMAAAIALRQNKRDLETYQRHEIVQHLPEQLFERFNALEKAIQNTVTKEEIILQTRESAFNAQVASNKIKRELKQEAVELWNNKPESERMKRVWFWKEEDDAKRRDFIEDYISEHFEERLKKDAQ